MKKNENGVTYLTRKLTTFLHQQSKSWRWNGFSAWCWRWCCYAFSPLILYFWIWFFFSLFLKLTFLVLFRTDFSFFLLKNWKWQSLVTYNCLNGLFVALCFFHQSSDYHMICADLADDVERYTLIVGPRKEASLSQEVAAK